MRFDERSSGVFAIAVTPFHPDGRLDTASIDRLADFYLECGVFLDFELERGADGAMTGYWFPDMLVELVAHSAAGERGRAHDLFDAHLPLMRYEQQPGVGLAARKHVLQRRGAIASDAQRAPASSLSAAARAEVDYLLARLARVDTRAEFAVRSGA